VAPQLFYQLYVIHGFIRERTLPLVYALLPGKSEAVYGELFNDLLKHVTRHPNSITIDFEEAVENIIKQKLPTTTISGCFFHFKQSLWRKIQDLGQPQPFITDRELRHYLKNFACLAFVPEAFVAEEFEKFQHESPDSISDQKLPRTNNSSKGWHHALKNSARINPSIYESIEDLQMEQHANLIMTEKLNAGLVKLTKRTTTAVNYYV
ncbi:unnamed protein product, partial [Didymodactylos carnosus]